MKQAFQIVVIFALIAFGIRQYIKYRVAPKLPVEQLVFTDMNGTSITWNQLADKPVFINFFATWCAPCNVEMPDLEALKSKLGDEIIFIAVSDESPEKINRFKDRHQSTYQFLRLGKDGLANIGIHTYPTSYLLSADGEILFNHIGVEKWSSDKMVDKFKALIQ